MPWSMITSFTLARRSSPRMKKPKFGPKRSSPSPPPCTMNPVLMPLTSAPLGNTWLSFAAMSGPTPANSAIDTFFCW